MIATLATNHFIFLNTASRRSQEKFKRFLWTKRPLVLGMRKKNLNSGHVHYPKWELLIGQKVKKGPKKHILEARRL